jgi:hypothetical protein
LGPLIDGQAGAHVTAIRPDNVYTSSMDAVVNFDPKYFSFRAYPGTKIPKPWDRPDYVEPEPAPQCVVMGQEPVHLAVERREIGEVHHADGTSADLVLVGRADAAPGGPDPVRRTGGFARDIELLMQSEDLHIAPVITWWNKQNPWATANSSFTNARFINFQDVPIRKV